MRSLAGRGASVSVVHPLHPVTHVGAARVSSCDQPSVTDCVAAAADAPTIYVCVTCRPVAAPASELRAAAGTEVTLRPMRCLANCSRGPSAALRCNGSWTYVFGGLDPAFAGALVEGARLLARAADGILPWRGRPEPLKRGLIARVPPIGFEEVDA